MVYFRGIRTRIVGVKASTLTTWPPPLPKFSLLNTNTQTLFFSLSVRTLSLSMSVSLIHADMKHTFTLSLFLFFSLSRSHCFSQLKTHCFCSLWKRWSHTTTQSHTVRQIALEAWTNYHKLVRPVDFVASLARSIASLKSFDENLSEHGSRHSLANLSMPTILPPRVRIPNTPSMLLSFIVKFVLYLSCERNQNKQKEAGLGPFLIFSSERSLWTNCNYPMD